MGLLDHEIQLRMKKFLSIAVSLGIAVPSSLAATNAQNVNVYPNEGINQPIDNEVIQRINMFYSEDAIVDVTSMAHTNSHTDVGGNHTDYHSNLAHSNTHTNKSLANACGHTNVHSDRNGYNSHTDSGRTSHNNYHTNREC